ncbi:MAG: DUF1292 domain-containing protein [Christensenellales bacterium]|jgi:hypothetical protein
MQDIDNIIEFTDEEGNKLQLEIIDFFGYKGQEYVILTEPCHCDEECDECEDHSAYVMMVNALDDETEEYLPIDQDMEEEVIAYAESLLAGEFDDEEDEDEEE